MNNKKLSIKSAGYINGEYLIILSDDSILDRVRYLDVKKDVNSFGVVTAEIYLNDTDSQTIFNKQIV